MKHKPQQHRTTLSLLSQPIQMQQQMQTADRWFEAKTDKSHPTTTHNPDIYAVIVGFEVNHPDFAFKNNVHKLGNDEATPPTGDFGHAFFYITKNDQVMKFFSFGPKGLDKYGGNALHRPGTPDYTVPNTVNVKLFRLLIKKSSYDTILKETNRVRNDILKGHKVYHRGGHTIVKQYYTAAVNDTCAETARDILVKGIPNIPDGTGPVDATAFGSWIPIVNAVNPYMWHYNFKRAGYREFTVKVGEINWDEDIIPEVAKGRFVLDPAKELFLGGKL